MTTEQAAFELTPCRLCGANEADELWWDHDKAFELPGRFLWARCRRCGGIYLRHRPTPESIGVYYPSNYAPFRRAIQDEKSPLIRWARNRSLGRRCNIAEHHWGRPPGTILDVGCATGIFLDAMSRRGWTTAGVEPSTSAAAYARDRFGLEVFNGTLSEAPLQPNSWDVITLWDVLEHTFDPLYTLQTARRLLVHTGIIALTLPNWGSLDRRLFKQHWIGYDCPRHLFAFPQPALRDLLARSGFELVRHWCDLGGYFTFASSLQLWLKAHVSNPTAQKALVSLAYFPGVRFPFMPLFYLLDHIGMGPSLTVVARRL